MTWWKNHKVFVTGASGLLGSSMVEELQTRGAEVTCLVRDWVHGIYTIDTAKSKSISGWIGGKTFSLGNVKFEITTANASIAVSFDS